MRWFRFYDDVVNDPKVQNIAPPLFKSWVNLLCLASKYDGRLPPIRDIAFALRIAPGKAETIIQALVNAGLIDRDDAGLRPHNWAGRQRTGDDSAERQKRYRDRKRSVTSNGHDRDASRDGDALEERREDTDKNRGEETRDVTREDAARADGEAIRILGVVKALFGKKLEVNGWHWSTVAVWLKRGYTEAEIVAVADRARQKGKCPGTLDYFTPALDEYRTKGAAKAPDKPKRDYSDY